MANTSARNLRAVISGTAVGGIAFVVTLAWGLSLIWPVFGFSRIAFGLGAIIWFFLTAAFGVFLFRLVDRNNIGFYRKSEGRCIRCGYDLRASDPQGRCPECGAALTDQRV
ncbi:MAG: hypothetical protein CMJ18_11300 [Phycisphaeraceae bacterium]|nr:hypothetical protein [Phycisphaeraceae bacterium]